MIEIHLLLDEPTAKALVGACVLWNRTHVGHKGWTDAVIKSIEVGVARAIADPKYGTTMVMTQEK